MRVAVIDSGVNPRHPHISGVAGGVSINAQGALTEGDYLDRLGHGTAVMAAIQEKAPRAECFAVRIFHDALRTSSVSLHRALEWALDERMDVINLSLGTRNPAHAELFRPLVERAADAGVAVVSAHDCYPGCLPGAFAVDLDPQCARDRYSLRGETFVAAGYPRDAPGIPRERNLQGISFAVANMSGFAARLLETMPGRELRKALKAQV